MHRNTAFKICPHFAADFSAFVDGVLPHPRAGEMQAHVDNCPTCLRHLVAYRRGVTVLRSIGGASADPDFGARLERRLAGSPDSDRRAGRPTPFSLTRLRGAAFGVAAILASVIATRPPIVPADARVERAAIAARHVPVVVPSEPLPVDEIGDPNPALAPSRPRAPAPAPRTEVDRAFERLEARLLTGAWERPTLGDDGWVAPVRLEAHRVTNASDTAPTSGRFSAVTAVFSSP